MQVGLLKNVGPTYVAVVKMLRRGEAGKFWWRGVSPNPNPSRNEGLATHKISLVYYNCLMCDVIDRVRYFKST